MRRMVVSRPHAIVVIYLSIVLALSSSLCGALQPHARVSVGNNDLPCLMGCASFQAHSNHPESAKAAATRRQQWQQQQQQLHNSNYVVGTRHLTAKSAAQAPATVPTPIQPQIRQRRLKQLAGLGNFLVGAKIAGNQQGVMAAGVASQLANFYGLEGLGFRHNLGALPSPGALELLAAGGFGALPSSEGLAAGFVGQTIQSLASTVNPATASALGQTLKNVAASTGLGNLAGAAGLGKLGLGSDQPGLSGAMGTGSYGVGSSDLGLQGYTSASESGMSGMIPDKAAAAAAVLTTGAHAAGQMIQDKGQLAGVVIGTAGQVAGALISAAGQIKGQILSNAAQVKGSVVSNAADATGEVMGHAGQMAGQAIQGVAQAAEIVAQNKDAIKSAVGAKVGNALKGAGELLLAKFGDQSSGTVYSMDYATHTSNNDGANGNVYYDNGQTMTMMTGGSGDASGMVTSSDSNMVQPGAVTQQVVGAPAYSSTGTTWSAQTTAGTTNGASVQGGPAASMVAGPPGAQNGATAYATQPGQGQQGQVAASQGQQGMAGQLQQGNAYQLPQGVQQPTLGPQPGAAAAQVQQGIAAVQQGYGNAAAQMQQGAATATGQMQQSATTAAGQVQQGYTTATGQMQQGAMTAAGQTQQGVSTAAGQM